MIKLRKFIKRIILGITAFFIAFILLFGVVWASLQSDYVQTKAVNFFANILSSSLKSKVSVGSVTVAFFNKLVLKDVQVLSLRNESIASVKELRVSLNQFSYKQKTAKIGRLYIDKGVFNLRQYKNGKTNIEDWLNSKSTDTTSTNWQFVINSVKLNNCRFSYYREGIVSEPDVFDYENTDVKNICCLIDNIKIKQKFIVCDMQYLSFKERCGFTMVSLNSQFFVSGKSLNFSNLSLKTDKSMVEARFGHFGYDSFDSYKDFLTKVVINCRIDNSKVSMADISCFTKELKGLNQVVDAKGYFKGTVSDFAVTNASISLLDSTKFEGKVEISGLPDIQNTYFFIDAKKLKTSMNDIASIPLYPFINGEKIVIDPSLKKIGSIKYSGNFTGFIYDVVAFGKISTSLGNVTSDLLIKQLKNEKEIKLSGKFSTEKFNLGKLLGKNTKIGKVDMNVKINTTFNDKGFKASDLNGAIAAIEFNNYNYRNIAFDGLFTPKAFDGKASINDRNLDMSFLGKCDFSQKIPAFDFSAHVGHLNFHRLNLLKGDTIANVSFNLHTQITGNKIDNLNGSIAVDSVLFENKKGQTFVNKVALDILNRNDQSDFNLKSDEIDAHFYGNFTAENLIKNAIKSISFYVPSLLAAKNIENTTSDDKLKFSIKIKDVSEFSKTLLPQITIKNPISILGEYSSKQHFIKIDANAVNVTIGSLSFCNFTFDLNTSNKCVTYSSAFDIPIFNVDFKQIAVNGKIQNDSVLFACNWLKDDSILYKGNINSVGIISRNQFSNEAFTKFTILPTNVVVADSVWKLSKSVLSIDSTVSISGFNFSNKDQVLKVEGTISTNPQDSLYMSLSNFELKYFNKFIKDKNLGMQGNLSGYISIFELSTNFHFRSKIKANGFYIAGTDYGTLYALSEWDETNKSIEINVYTERGTIRPIDLKGFYYPEDNIVDMTLFVNNANLSIISVFVKDFFSDLKGYIVGEVHILGKINKPEMKGYLDLKKASLFVDYLNTRYNLSGRCLVDNQKIKFDNVQVFDSEGNPATANGDLQFPNFNTFTYNIVVDTKNFIALDTKANNNNYFYGKAYVTGVTKIYGDLNQTQIDVSAKSNPNTIINVPISSQTTIENNTFLTFRSKTEKPKKVIEETSFEGIIMNFELEVTPDAEIQLILDEKVGDIIRSKGNGTIQMNIDTKGKFNMYGTYEIFAGDYLFTMRNLINKKFTIEPGSKLVWTGSAFDATADIVAKYKLKTSLFPLMSLVNDTNAIYKKRIPIECKINLTDKILTPSIAFSVDMKDADEKAKQVFNNLSEDEKNKQFMSLLVLTSFYSYGSGTSNSDQTANSYKSSGTEMFTSQLSNLLSNINKDLNVGVNYRYGSPTSKLNDQVELAISTELLNNRVVVNLNGYSAVKSATSPTTTENNALGGDVNVEVKLNKTGTLRAKGFTRSNNDNLNLDKKGDTQGVGLSYAKNFNKFGDLFVNNKRRKIVEEQKKE